jgi:transposase
METLYFLGIDVSKKTLDAALTIDGKSFFEGQLENNPRAIHAWFTELRKKASFSTDKIIVCMEHTGVYCHHLLAFFHKKKLKVCLESAMQIKRSQGIVRGKTDKIDARRIALYALKNRDHLRFWNPQRECIQKLKALLITRERLVKTRMQLEVPIAESDGFLELSLAKAMKIHCQKTLSALKVDIKKIEKEILKVVREDESIGRQYELVTSVPGIGPIVGLNVIVSTDEFKAIREAKKFACYTGIAPFEHSSGTSIRGKTRVSNMANMRLKRLLHLAAMSAIQHNEELSYYYNRKLATGKNKMSVANAVRNKLIHRIFSCIKNNRPYQIKYQNALA